MRQCGDVEQAVQDTGHVKKRLGSSRRCRLPYLRAEAILASHHGEFDQALGYLSEAAQLAEDIGLPGEAWSIQAELGETHQHRGSEEMASQAFARASETLLSLADKLEEEQQRTAFLSAVPARRVLERAQFSP